MIASLERTLSTAQQNKDQTRNPHAFYRYQIFALDSIVVITQKLFSSHGGFLTYAIYHHRETSQRNNLNKLTHYDETKKKGSGLTVRAKENQVEPRWAKPKIASEHDQEIPQS